MIVERGGELARLREIVRSAGSGRPSLTLVRGPLGIGRTTLLQQLPELLDGEDVCLLWASAAPTEQDFAFGVVRQLFDTVLVGAGAAARARWARGDAALARPVLADAPDDAGAAVGDDAGVEGPSVLYGLRSMLANIDADVRLLMLVDDLQWADEPSLRFLAYLARRLHGLRTAMVCTLRDGDPRVRHGHVGAVADLAHEVLRPAPLTLAGAAAAIAEQFGEPGHEDFVRACHETSAGNPLFLKSVLLCCACSGLRPSADHVDDIRSMRPSELRERLAACLRAHSPAVRAVVNAIAALGEQGPPELVARLAGLDKIGFAEALRELGQLGLLTPDHGPCFVHPVVKDAVESAMTLGQRQRLHDTAAELLYHYGYPAEQVAAQLMAVPTSRQPWSVEVLRAAAGAALRRGAPYDAALYLRHALLDGSAQGEQRARLLIDLATAERGFDLATCERHIAQAVPLLTRARDRATAALQLAPAVLDVTSPAVVDLFHEVAHDLGPAASLTGTAREVALRLEARLRHFGHDDPAELASAVERLRELGGDPPLGTGAERDLAAVLGYSATLSARIPATDAARLAEAILQRELPGAAQEGSALPLAILTLIAADLVHPAVAWLASERESLRPRESTVTEALVQVEEALVLLARGRLVAARERAERAEHLAATVGPGTGGLSTAVLAMVAMELRDRALTERVLASVERGSESMTRSATLQLLQASVDTERGDWQRALDTLLASGRMLDAAGWRNPVLFAWRPWAATLQHRLGDTHAAAALLEEEYERAMAWGAPLGIGRVLRVRSRLLGDGESVRMLREAVSILRGSANQLELARVLVQLGEQLGSGPEAAAALAEGATLAGACRAFWLVERARSAPDAQVRLRPALTRTERLVASLAGQGLTNQGIAEELGVSSRAVEKHLTNSYRKLGVTGRPGLVRLIADADEVY